jgi:two-component system sensor histidine kinase CpxA
LLDIRILVAFLALGTCFAAVMISRWFDRMESRFDALAGLECETALSSFETDGPEKLQSVMQKREAISGVRAWLFDENGKALGGGPTRSALLSKESWLARLLASPQGRHHGDVWVVAKVGGYSCVVTSDLKREFHGTRSIQFLSFLAILCCAIAGYVTLRMRRLEAAISRFGAGKLEIRLPSDNRDPIRRLSEAFNQMADRVESLVDAHRRLCIDVSHELRSPLTRLRLAIGLARSGTRGALNQIELESFRLNDLVDQLLDVARAEVDPTALKREIIDMRSLMAEVVDDCAIEARERGCELDLQFIHPGVIIGDAELLRRAIENPLRNAIRHSPTGSPIEVNSGGDDAFAMVSIQDRGPGIPESALQQIFRPFYRVDAGRDRDTGGAGLGLAIAERAVALHRGSIRAENSAPGLRVEIRLPRK